MTRSAIATQRKKPQTPGQRLHALDPDLARFCDTWEADDAARLRDLEHDLDFAYSLALTDQPAPPILDEEEKLAFKLGQFALTADSMLDLADRLAEDRDAACMVLGRVEHVIAQRTLEAFRMTPQAALPAPVVAGGGNGGDGDPKLDDDETLRMIHQAALEVLEDADPEGLPVGDDGLPEGTPPWDDPEGAHIVSIDADAIPTGRKPHGWGRRWIAGATAWCITIPTIGMGLWMAGLHLLGGRS